MEEHVEKTIAELDSRIGALEAVKWSLQVVFGGDSIARTWKNPFVSAPEKDEQRPANPVPEDCLPKHIRRAWFKPGKARVKAKAKGKKVSARAKGLELAERILAAMAGLDEPFGGEQVQAETGGTKKQVHQALYRFRKSGWLKREGCNRYRRTDDFPIAKAAAGPAVELPVDRAPGAAQRRELLEAQQAYDGAVAAGRHKLADIHGQHVARLKKELGL